MVHGQCIGLQADATRPHAVGVVLLIGIVFTNWASYCLDVTNLQERPLENSALSFCVVTCSFTYLPCRLKQS